MSQRDYVTFLRSPNGESRLWNVFCFYIPYYLPMKDLAFSTSTKRACAISLQEYGSLYFLCCWLSTSLTPSFCDEVLAIGRSPSLISWQRNRRPPLVCLHAFIAPKLLLRSRTPPVPDSALTVVLVRFSSHVQYAWATAWTTFKTRERATRLEDGRFI